MTIQLTQTYKNNIYKDNMYVTISKDCEIENLLYLKFYNNINNITVELMQIAKKEIIRKILLIEHIDKIIYRNTDGVKEEINTNRKLIVKMQEKEGNNILSDDTIIRFQQILDITNNTIVVQNINILSNELLDLLQKNNAEYIRIMDYGNYKYTIQQIRNIKAKVKEYIEIANQKSTKTEKFIELYKTLCNKLYIDNLGTSCGNICDIIYNKTTIKGYSEILKYILDEMQIESKIITGNLINGDLHYWNQVKLGYLWYNTDLALDAKRKLQTEELKYCLKSDEDFYEDHIALTDNIEICTQDSNYFIIEEIEKKEGFIVRLFKKLTKMVNKRKIKKLSTGESKI